MSTPHHGPRTLIVSWHWPPTNRASAAVLGSLFGAAPADAFRVLTRAFEDASIVDRRQPTSELDALVPRIPVSWPADDQSQPTARMWPVVGRTLRAMLDQACEVHRRWPIERVLAVYPHRLSLLVGWRISRRLGVPLVAYMHDLCAEALTFRNPLRRRFWTDVDRAALREAWLVVVPTDEFARHYRQRGVHRTWVLPHCVPASRPTAPPPNRSGALRLLYSGNLYEPHADAMRAFIAAVDRLPGTSTTYLARPEALGGLMGRLGARWVTYEQLAATLPDADVFVVVLGQDTPCPEEVMGCFPSKLIDYLSVGRPILAIVPAGSFVDRLVATSGCGVVVRQHDKDSIRQAVAQMRDPGMRAAMIDAGQRLLRELDSRIWMPRLLERLRLGPPDRSLAATSPDVHDGEPHAPAPVGPFETLMDQGPGHESALAFLAGADSQR